MTEQEMRETTVPTPKTAEELAAYIEDLRVQPHDYGTCVYAMSMAAVATFNHMASQLGVTGFQASCADMDILTRTRGYKGPWAIIDSHQMLYPQYDLPGRTAELLDEWAPWAAEEAKKLLAEATDFVHPSVRAHWEQLAASETSTETQS